MVKLIRSGSFLIVYSFLFFYLFENQPLFEDFFGTKNIIDWYTFFLAAIGSSFVYETKIFWLCYNNTFLDSQKPH